MREYTQALLSELKQQPSDIQVVCSACSAYNWLKLAGAPITPEEGDSLIQQVLNTKQPLGTAYIENLAQGYGYEVKTMPSLEKYSVVDEFVPAVVDILQTSPILLTISSRLAQKDRTVKAAITYQDMEKPEGKLVVHSVVAARGTTSETALIIDPYNLRNPEIFDTTQPDQRLRMASWFMSAFYQWKAEKRGIPDAEQMMALAQSELSQPELASRIMIHVFGITQAEPRYLRKIIE